MLNRNKHGESGITLIASNCEIAGDLHFSDQMQISGIVKGNIYAQAGSKSQLTIGHKGLVHGEIRVPNVIVNGKVYGDIHSDNHIELAAKAEIYGDIYYKLVEMVKGSRVDGKMVYRPEGRDDVAKPKATKALEKPEKEQAVASVSAVKSKRA